MLEPNCDMPWEIYLDWLQDQGNEELRGFDINCICCTGYQYDQYIGIAADNNTLLFNCGEGIGGFQVRFGCVDSFIDYENNLHSGGGYQQDFDYWFSDVFQIPEDTKGTEFIIQFTGAG